MITSFRGDHWFLSSFYDGAPFRIPWWGDKLVPTREHGFQAAKTALMNEREWVLKSSSAREAKFRGRQVTKHPTWDMQRKSVMFRLIMTQMDQNSTMRDALLKTGEHILVEGNIWHDSFWGACYCPDCRGLGAVRAWFDADANWAGKGDNWLGRIWMMHRELIAP